MPLCLAHQSHAALPRHGGKNHHSLHAEGTLRHTLLEAPPSISVGIVSADLMNLGREVKALEQAGARILHFDVMDDCLVPLLTVGAPFIKQVRTSMLKDVHLMVTNPLEKVKHYVAAGADMLTVQIESCNDLRPVLQRMGEMFNANDPARGVLRGVGIFPDTPLERLEPLMDLTDMVVLLAVDPRGGPQPTLDQTIKRANSLKNMLANHGGHRLLCIDGNVNRGTIRRFASINANLLVSGNAIFLGSTADNLHAMLHTIGGFIPEEHISD